jgi:hypothetical protein
VRAAAAGSRAADRVHPPLRPARSPVQGARCGTQLRRPGADRRRRRDRSPEAVSDPRRCSCRADHHGRGRRSVADVDRTPDAAAPPTGDADRESVGDGRRDARGGRLRRHVTHPRARDRDGDRARRHHARRCAAYGRPGRRAVSLHARWAWSARRDRGGDVAHHAAPGGLRRTHAALAQPPRVSPRRPADRTASPLRAVPSATRVGARQRRSSRRSPVPSPTPSRRPIRRGRTSRRALRRRWSSSI